MKKMKNKLYPLILVFQNFQDIKMIKNSKFSKIQISHKLKIIKNYFSFKNSKFFKKYENSKLSKTLNFQKIYIFNNFRFSKLSKIEFSKFLIFEKSKISKN